MSEYQALTVLASFTFLYSLLASRLARSPINGALVYVSAGLLLGPMGLGAIDFDVDAESFSLVVELTLAVVLFTDAANANLKVLRSFKVIPVRLLLIGLPLTIALGLGVGTLLFRELGLFELALLATMLAPTDAALGKAVVTNTSVPQPVRESLNVESGLNDGICVPLLLLFLALAGGQISGMDAAGLAVLLPFQSIGIGVVVGAALGLLGSAAVRICYQRGWTTGTWLQIPVIALSVICFALAQWIGGSGFIACFVGGMAFGALTQKHKEDMLEAADLTGEALALIAWFVFGTLLFTHTLPYLDWRVVTYAIASLTIIRMLPVFLSVAGLGLRTETKLFFGWFGPRGLASIVFTVLVINAELPGGNILVATATMTILFSILAHGLSANPLATAYSQRLRGGRI